MRKILLSLIFCLAILFSVPAFASAYDTNNISVNSVMDNQGYTIFNANINCGGNAWIEFNDGSGFVVPDGNYYIYHQYPANGNYCVSVLKDQKTICQTKVNVKGKTNSNQLSLIASNLNHLTVRVNCNSKTQLNWGDGTSVTLKDNNLDISHDYAYNVNSYAGYTLTLGSGCDAITATFTIDDILKTSTFNNGNSSEITKIAINSTTSDNNSISISSNDWKIGNIVILPLNTAIYESHGDNFRVLNLVQNSFWLAKVISGPNYFDGTNWWQIQLANDQTGWVKEINPPTVPFN